MSKVCSTSVQVRSICSSARCASGGTTVSGWSGLIRESAVVASVTKNRGGLGYVAARTALTRVKQLALTD